ncbi:MAG: nucleotidyltransferase domain-containing protein [archaeon]
MVKYKNNEIKLSAKEKLLKYLIENKSPKSIRAASCAIVVDYKNTHNLVNKLQSDVISKEKIGNINLIKIKLKPNQEIFSVENKRAAQFLKENGKLELVRKDVESINYPFFIVLVFGSFIKKTKTKKSDIDICIICDNTEESKKLMSKLELLPIKLEFHNFTAKEFESMLKTKEENIGKEVVKNNIILYGIENYYNLISKWMKKE